MLAPWPETLWAYRRVWSQISAVGRLVALDMPGFGHSDQPERLIAPDAMGDFLALLIDQWGLSAPAMLGCPYPPGIDRLETAPDSRLPDANRKACATPPC